MGVCSKNKSSDLKAKHCISKKNRVHAKIPQVIKLKDTLSSCSEYPLVIMFNYFPFN